MNLLCSEGSGSSVDLIQGMHDSVDSPDILKCLFSGEEFFGLI